jgi:hypothetical protein
VATTALWTSSNVVRSSGDASAEVFGVSWERGPCHDPRDDLAVQQHAAVAGRR